LDGVGVGKPGYLQCGKDWTITLDAIKRLAARLGRPFAYDELGTEIEEHDRLKVTFSGYTGALNAVSKHLPADEPLWISLVVNAKSGVPGPGFWSPAQHDSRYVEGAQLSEDARPRWLELQQQWCIARARLDTDPENRSLQEAEAKARDRARKAFIDLRSR
jgi:hypothetical protein